MYDACDHPFNGSETYGSCIALRLQVARSRSPARPARTSAASAAAAAGDGRRSSAAAAAASTHTHSTTGTQ